MPKAKQAYECSNCGAQFESRAQPGNVRHKCADGKTGVGKMLDGSGEIRNYVKEETPQEEVKDVEAIRKDVDVVEEIPGDVEFTLEEDVENTEDLDLGTMPTVEAPEVKKPKSKPTKKSDRNKIQGFIRGMYALTGQVDLSPDEEAEILADIWAGVGEVHVETPQIHVGGGMYMLCAGLITVGLMGKRQLGAWNQAKAFKQAMAKKADQPKELEPHEGWD